MKVTHRVFLNRAMLLIVLALVLIGSTSAQSSSRTRGITAEDYFSFEFVSDPNISPDGKLVAYVVTKIDKAQNRRNSAIWMTATDGGGKPWQFTTAPQNSTSPRWSPDGSALAFISSRPVEGTPGNAGEAPKSQVYVLPMSGGEARRVTNLKNGVSLFRWSPDGSRLAVISRSGPSDLRTESKERSDVRHYKDSSYKFNDSGWFDDKRTHIWTVDVPSGAAKQITEGDDWNDSDPQWSPDGSLIAFVSNRTGKEFNEDRNTDVWVVKAQGGALTRISDHSEADNQPRWSPDGKWIAFTGEIVDRDHPKIFLAPSAGEAPSVLAADGLDLIPGAMKWSSDGKAIFFETGVKGENHLFRVDLNKRSVTQVTSGARAVKNVDMNFRSGKMVYLSNDFRKLDDVYISGLDGGGERRLTTSSQQLWKQLELATIERFTYKGADNWDIDGFLVKPLGWKTGEKYPLIFSIHGGPAGQYGVDWFHEFQVYAAKGYAVFFTNPRGSTGYGQKFERGIAGEWGGKDYVDMMNGVDAVLAEYPWIDKDRMGVTGGSYGGYAANWIVGHTNRFKAAVTLRSISNFISDDGTRDGAYGHESDFGGDIFQKHDLYWDRSPLKYADKVKTPTLILHSDNDLRVPIEQAEQWFRALKHFGVTTEIVFFPRENHNLTRTGEPRHLVESMNWQLYWFDRFVNGNQKAIRPNAN